MKFPVPRIWRELTNHSSDSYFCLVYPSKRRVGKNASATRYSNILSIASVPHSSQLPVPTPPLPPKKVSEDDSSIIKNGKDTANNEDYITSQFEQKSPIFPSNTILTTRLGTLILQNLTLSC